MILRPYCESDAAALWQVFRSAVLSTTPRYYTVSQCTAWLSAVPSLAHWQARMQTIQPSVVCLGGQVVAYGDLQSDGFIDHFFVSAAYQGRGIGEILLQHLLTEAQQRGCHSLHAYVSLAAQGFFSRYGFTGEQTRQVVIGGISLTNTVMRRQLTTKDEGGCPSLSQERD